MLVLIISVVFNQDGKFKVKTFFKLVVICFLTGSFAVYTSFATTRSCPNPLPHNIFNEVINFGKTKVPTATDATPFSKCVKHFSNTDKSNISVTGKNDSTKLTWEITKLSNKCYALTDGLQFKCQSSDQHDIGDSSIFMYCILSVQITPDGNFPTKDMMQQYFRYQCSFEP